MKWALSSENEDSRCACEPKRIPSGSRNRHRRRIQTVQLSAHSVPGTEFSSFGKVEMVSSLHMDKS